MFSTHCYFVCVCENEMNVCESENSQHLMYNTLNIPVHVYKDMLAIYLYVHTPTYIYMCVYACVSEGNVML